MEKKLYPLLLLLALTGISLLLSEIYLAETPLAVIKGRSMLPLLREGDIVFIVKVKPDEIVEGDIVVFEWRGGLIIHRVVDRVVVDGKYYYVTKGDNNPFEDVYYYPGAPFEKIIGKTLSINGAVFKIPYLGSLTLLLRGEYGFSIYR